MPVTIKPDRVTLPNLTSAPTSLARGDIVLVNDTLQIAVGTTPTLTKLLISPVGTADIADGAITTTKIADGAVTTTKIAVGAVTNDRIASVNLSKVVVDVDLNMGGKNITNVGSLSVTTSVSVGDLVFKNGWRFTEDGDDLVLVSPTGKKYKLTLIPVE